MHITLPLLAGIIAAIVHVLSGPDHLAAVTPFAVETKKKAWKVGLFWGIGHISGMLAIGVLFLLFKELLPVDLISAHSEKLVGIILILLGLWIFYKIFIDNKKHKHTHIHVNENPIIHVHPHKHIHSHEHTAEKLHEHQHSNIKQSALAALSFGFIHGLAGIAHFLLFLPVLGFTSKISAIQYIIGFAIGTLLAMISFAFLIGKIATVSKKGDNPVFFRSIRLASGLFALLIGVYWIIAN